MNAAPPSRVIFQPIRGRPLHRLLWKRLGLPRGLVHPALRTAKTLVNPAQVRRRRRLAEGLHVSPALGEIAPELGFLRFAAGTLPEIDAAVARCQAIHRTARNSPPDPFNPGKDFLRALASGDDFCAHPDLVRFMVSRPILDTVSRYLGSVPLLAGAALLWSPPNQTARASQLYHFDDEDEAQIKVLVNVLDTGSDQGPFTFLPADLSQRVREEKRHVRGRLSDSGVEAISGSDAALTLLGPSGSGAFVDTARCLHFGSRGNARERLLLVIQFLRFDAPSESRFRIRFPADALGLDLDPHQRLALGVR